VKLKEYLIYSRQTVCAITDTWTLA